jgi:hypothetical protein
MYILNSLLLFCFINLCNSFTLTNKNIYTTFFSRNLIYKINMGCDYYIDKNLNIYDHNNKIFSFINLEHEKGYYWFSSILDEDEEGYDIELSRYIKTTLEPSMKPIVIYSNNSFNKLSYENKYKKLIDYDLNLYNKTWNDINRIVKIENRYER